MWISVKDRLPEMGHPVDIWRRGSGRLANCICYHLSITGSKGTPLAQWNMKYGGYAGGATVSHWMEIPEPPTEELNDATRSRPEEA